jgi:alpha-glucosidase
MLNFPKSWIIDGLEDVAADNFYNNVKEQANGDPKAITDAMEYLHTASRDNCRTPMQCDGTKNAGFITGKPWFHLNPNYGKINVEKQIWDPYSILSFYRHALRFRKAYADAMIRGIYDEVYEDSEELYCYFKRGEKHTLFVAMNFTDKVQELALPLIPRSCNGSPPDSSRSYRLLLTSVQHHEDGTLQPYEGAIFLVK